jgi:hypothetical protein
MEYREHLPGRTVVQGNKLIFCVHVGDGYYPKEKQQIAFKLKKI